MRTRGRLVASLCMCICECTEGYDERRSLEHITAMKVVHSYCHKYVKVQVKAYWTQEVSSEHESRDGS